MAGEEFPFLNPAMYNPGQFAFGNNAEMSQLISMFAGPLLQQMAGPGNFMPHMMPGQALFDQFAMRNYQNQTRTATFNLAGAQDSELATRLLGMRSVMTGEKATDLNRAQAANMAGMLNNPLVKSFMGMAIGPENLEAMLHGSRGDIQNLGNTINKIGYFRRDPGGGGRMDAESLEDLTTGVFSHLYEPQGNLDKLAGGARRGDDKALQRLKAASRMEDKSVIGDADVESRLLRKDSSEIDSLYKKYVQGGTATDSATQAKELVKFDRAIKEAGVLSGDEATVSMLQTRAERLPTDEMHGFMAGQVSQVAENLAQRGVLPPSIGALSAKDRVGAIAETKLDEATIDRLARTMAERDLEKSDTEAGRLYREAASPDERKAEVDKVIDSYKLGIKDTQSEAERFARGESSKSAEEVLQGMGGEALAGNVDASRTASKLKSYTDSLSAVRDIFGDNGNPNAPMPALMAALDQLTQGGMGQMNPGKMAQTLRQMQTLARETGTGMQQLAQMSAVAGNMGQQLGIAPSVTMQNVANTLGITKAAMDGGAFSNNVFGTVGKEQFQNQTIQNLQQTEASGNSKALAAMNRIYKMDTKKFAGKELEAAMAAYNDPNNDGTYTFGGQKKNLYDLIGKGRHFAALDILEKSGASQSDFYSAVNSPLTQQYANAGKAYLTRKHEITQTLSTFGTRASVKKAIAGSDTLKGMDQKEITNASNVITGMVIDTAGSMSPEDQITYLQNNLETKLREQFEQTHDKPTAAKMAKEMAQKVGADRSSLSRLIGNMDTYASGLGMGNIAEIGQRYGKNMDAYGLMEVGNAASRAEAQRKMIGYETGPGQRASDYFLDIGKRGEKFNLDQFMKAVAPAIGDKEVLKQYAGRMGAGMHSLAEARNDYQVTQKDIDKLAADAAKGNKTAEAQLKELGGVESDVNIIYQKEIDAARETKLAGMDREELLKTYSASYGKDSSGAHLTDAQLRESLKDNAAYKTAHGQEYVTEKRKESGAKYLTERQMMSSAMSKSLGQAKKGADAGELENIKTMQRAVERGQDEGALQEGVRAMFRSKTFQGAFSGMGRADRKELESAILEKGDSTEAILKKMGISSEDFEKNKNLAYKDKTVKQRAAEAAIAMDAAHEFDQDKMGAAAEGAEAGKQKVDKAQIDATTVVINADNVSGGGGASGAAVQTSGSPLPTSAEGVDAELAAIEEKRKSRAGMGGALTNEESNRKAELEQQREKLAQKTTEAKSGPEQKGAATPDGTAASAATAPEGAYSSANITPAGLNQPQQQGTTVLASTGGGGGGGATNVVGTLTINNLREGVLALMNEGGGVPPAGNGPTVFNGNSTTTT